MNEALHDIILARLTAASLDGDAESCVFAALEGSQALEAFLGGEAPAPARAPGEPASPTRGAYLASVAVQGFRGIGPRAQLDLTPSPGLTLVVGRNGSGKSSFAEGLEILLTGENQRWSARTKVWREGWRNLHAGDDASIEARIVIDGDAGPTTVARGWKPAADLEDSDAWIQRPGAKREPLDALGWTDALTTYRPFLSYNELGSMFEEGPSVLYDALSAILGLDDLTTAQAALRDARLSREKIVKASAAAKTGLVEQLTRLTDERAVAARELLAGKAPDLDELERIVTGAAEPEPADDVRALAAIAVPDVEQVRAAHAALSDAGRAVQAVAGSDAERDRRVADLLEQAIALHEQHGDGDCPVCGRSDALTSEWRERAATDAQKLRDGAQQAMQAHQAHARALRDARALIAPVPAGLPADARAAWEAWSALRDEDLLERMVDARDDLATAVEPVVADARAELARRESAWVPIATELAAWVDGARDARAHEVAIKPLKAAESWLKDASADIRNERFTPIASKAIANWQMLRQQSSVELGEITLAGAGSQRRVSLDVTIDGVDGAALGVMSQGELHALALSLFLPRATLPESPFRFVVIDDPVQSMDPARVDGLARVLEDVARERQVVVFTHDDRLPEATRRLGIAVRVIEVTRRLNSAVVLREATDPVRRLIEDALAVAWSDDLPARVGTRIVPWLCRQAVETVCLEVVRRKQIARGVAHADVEQAWEAATTTNAKAALALFDDAGKGGAVMQALNALGREYGDAFKACKMGGHEAYTGDLTDLARTTERLCEKLRQVR